MLSNDIEIYSNNKKINKEDIFSINRVKNKLTLNFRRELKPGEKIDIKAYKQPGKGKADAVFFAFDKASNDILIILDGDLTVAPETLKKFW